MGFPRRSRVFVSLILRNAVIMLSLRCCSKCCVAFTSFVFGDSLVDAGNNDYLITLSKADSPPYGIDFAPSKGNPTGRFTNGRTIPDIIDEALGAKSYTAPYLAPRTQANVTVRGLNFASGSSGILDETGSFFIGRVPLRAQVDYFEECRSNEIVKEMGEKGAAGFLKKAVFSVTTGSNDILNYIQPPVPFFRNFDNVSPPNFQHTLVSELVMQLKRLHKLGARKFAVVGTGPLGCIPFVRTLRLLPREICWDDANKLSQGYNYKLRDALDRLNAELGPDAIFVYANSYDIVAGIVQNHGQHGFENVNDPCCGGTIPPFVCSKGSVVCGDRTKYVFWDAYHPTEAANVIIAEKLLHGNRSLSSPINIRQLYNYSPN